ncbi:DNA-processing protein DprA [bacterium]|nr:DNA-processing protein DprA [bacterium]
MSNKEYQLKFKTDDDEIKYFVAFSYIQATPLFKAKLFEYFDFDIKRAFLADEKDLIAFSETFDINVPKTFLSKKNKLDIDKCYKDAFLDEKVKALTVNDEKYPPLLKEIPDYPLLLYYKGDLESLSFDYNLAVVGSRSASTNAKLALNNIISSFKNSNITIVSGLAYGVDAQAHKSAIENNIKTVAVIGSGLDYTYPAQNKNLYDEITNGAGVIFSEYPLKTPPVSAHFPQRNRIVVGMSKGTLVAEAAMKSGAMISANLTLEYNRELMCMPGNILNPNTQGIYYLIKNGAGIVVDAQDVLNQMDWDFTVEYNESVNVELNDIQKSILDIISIEAKSFDEIISEVSCNVSELMVALTELEIKGLVIQENNKYHKCK